MFGKECTDRLGILLHICACFSGSSQTLEQSIDMSPDVNQELSGSRDTKYVSHKVSRKHEHRAGKDD